MNLLQAALETYDALKELAGAYQPGKEPLAPPAHLVTKAQIEVTIDAGGRFIAAKRADAEQKIILPATEKSSGRTNSPAPHALCEQLGYLFGDDQRKFRLYTAALQEWVQSEHSHPKAAAVLAYVHRRTLRADLARAGITGWQEKSMVCWRVMGLGEASGPVWTDRSLMEAYTAYYLSRLRGNKRLCMLTGENTFITWQHLKGTFALNSNAKLLSANDTANFTYRGRFSRPEDAAAVGYLASQKAHNALKWLISNEAVIHGGRAFVCWSPQGGRALRPTLPLPAPPGDRSKPCDFQSYREELRRRLEGFAAQWTPSDPVVLAVFDAATDGRLAVTYYNQLLFSDWMARLQHWDETCCWADSCRVISSPPLRELILCAYGIQRGRDGALDADKALMAEKMQRLLTCRVDQAPFPREIARALVERASRLQNYSPANRNRLLHAACAAIQKEHIDHQKEAFDLALEPKRADRSYQWGRLLAVMEKIERDTFDETDRKRGRLPNALRLQTTFIRRPAFVYTLIKPKLDIAYLPRLAPDIRALYERLMGEIMEELSHDSDSYSKPLKDSYLLGYSLQKNALYAQKSAAETEETDHDA